ncbi:ATP-binding protein [Roseospirillum parvum]|uniref:histidine kinase n=1 Tax=Roseospirillum parvum TaxID=83401 RepID=A0A1G8FSG2_9PROT|nr:ATP-binding protein [Roseospirillum parvum]SDH85073.1 Signal transduction histidine kinase [Roseospirillum parvum]
MTLPRLRRLRPDSLAGWLAVLLLATLILSGGLLSAIFLGQRGDLGRRAAAGPALERLTEAHQQLAALSGMERQRLAHTLRSPAFHLFVGPEPLVLPPGPEAPASRLERRLAISLGERLDLFPQAAAVLINPETTDPRLRLPERPGFGWRGGRGGRGGPPRLGPDGGDGDQPPSGPERWLDHLQRQAGPAGTVLLVSLPLPDGEVLNAVAVLAPPLPPHPGTLPLLALPLLVLLGVAAVALVALRRATRPLERLAAAAERVGIDLNAPPLSESGPGEVRRASHAFNRMQERLARFVTDRTRMLAAISHDLRTPITRLRLRAELIDDEEMRERMIADLDEMEEMIAATLAFARDEAAGEDLEAVDPARLLGDLTKSFAEAGAKVRLDDRRPAGDRQPIAGRPMALRRAFANLIDNAMKYGGEARLTLLAGGDELVVEIDDNGPGLPEEALEEVFRPFHRLEGSRSRQTGGAGLGLAVVRSVVRGHGGDVRLANRPPRPPDDPGGLTARVALPANAAPARDDSPEG